MRSIGLLLLYINVTITILDIIHRPVFYRLDSVSVFSWTHFIQLVSVSSYRSQLSSKRKKTPWSKSASELYRQSDRRLSPKLVQTCADRGCHVVSVTDPYGRVLSFLDRSRYFSIK
jgi:hypothetical protein